MILKDKEVIDAIDIIGEYSHAAKRKILSGEVKIDKQVLKSLSTWQKEDIHRFVMEIENRSFEKNSRPTTNTTATAGATDHTKHENKTEMKSTLKTCIRMLEKLYRQM